MPAVEEEAQEDDRCPIFYVVLAQTQRLTYATAHAALLVQYGAESRCVLIVMHLPQEEGADGDSSLVPALEAQARKLTCSKTFLERGSSNKYRPERATQITLTYKCLMEELTRWLEGSVVSTSENSTGMPTYIAILEDDILPSPDFVRYLNFSRGIMEMDKTITCASGWNDNLVNTQNEGDNTRRWTFLDPNRFYLTNQFGGLGFMTRLDILKQLLHLLRKGVNWDVTTFDYFRDNQLNCIFPEIPRAYHIPWVEGRHATLLDRPLQIHESTMPDPLSLTTTAYGKFIEDHIVTHCHNKTQLRVYPKLVKVLDKKGWDQVRNDFPALEGVGLGGRMRLEWFGTIWAPPGPNRPRTLIVAGYSPFFRNYKDCQGEWVESPVEIDPMPAQQMKVATKSTGGGVLAGGESPAQPYPMPALLEVATNSSSEAVLAACWNPSSVSRWTISWDGEKPGPDFMSTIVLNLESNLRKIAGSRVRLVGKKKKEDSSVHISFEKSVGDAGRSCPQEFPLGTNERYTLAIQGKRIKVSCCAVFGCLHAIRSLSQLTVEKGAGLTCLQPVIRIEDEPKTPYRGLLIDTGRAYFTVPFLEKIIEGISFLGLNALHWHLTDDQSFPVEIKAYPELHQKGANWLGKIHGRCLQPVGSFYTQDDLRHLIEFARLRGVRIIPEIDIPAHTRSWGRGIPEISADCPLYVKKVGTRGVKGEYVVNVPLDVTSNKTLQVVKTVIGEIAELFPDPWLHLGGDELPMDCLLESKRGSGKTRLMDLNAAVVNFEAEIRSYLQVSFNKTAILWDDVSRLNGYASNGAVIEIWHREKIKPYTKGGSSIIDTHVWYLDVGCKTTSACHNRPATLSESLGGEACAWELTEGDCKSLENNGQEWERNFDKIVWKKLIGFAEAVWSKNTVEFDASRSESVAGQLQRRLGMKADLITVS
jgi:hexosaminidase